MRTEPRVDPAAWAYRFDTALFGRGLGFQPDPWQEKFLRSLSRQIILNCGRQRGKTAGSAVKVLDYASHHENSLVLMTASAGRQSSESFGRVRTLIEEQTPLEQQQAALLDVFKKTTLKGTFEEEFPPNVPGLKEYRKLSLTLSNNSRIVSLPCRASSVRSFSAVNILVIDEASWVPAEFFAATLPMLATTNGQVIVMSTPFGKSNFYWELWNSQDGSWEKYFEPSNTCPRISAEYLARMRATLGDWRYRQEFLCEFLDEGTTLFNPSDIDRSLTDDSEEVADIWGDALLDQPKPEPVPEPVRNILPGVPVGYEDELEDDRWS